MAFEKDWSHRASRDLKRIVDYHDAHDPDWTEVVVIAIMDKLDFLTNNPFLSSIYRQTSWGDVREALAGSYRLFFRVSEADQILRIERIQHVRQQDPEFSE